MRALDPLDTGEEVAPQRPDSEVALGFAPDQPEAFGLDEGREIEPFAQFCEVVSGIRPEIGLKKQAVGGEHRLEL